MKNKITKLPRVVALARYADLDYEVKQELKRDIGKSKVYELHEINDKRAELIFAIMERLEGANEIKGGIEEIEKILLPNKGYHDSTTARRTLKTLIDIADSYFILPIRLEDGLVKYCVATHLFNIQIVKNLEGKQTKVIVLSIESVKRWYDEIKKQTKGKNGGFVTMKPFELPDTGKILNPSTKAKIKKVHDFFEFWFNAKVVDKETIEIELESFFDKIGVLKRFKKDKTRTIDVYEGVLKYLVVNKVQISSFEINRKTLVLKVKIIK
jgi:hypothetical protein